MFERLDDTTPSPERMPASVAFWRDPLSPFVGLMCAFNVLMYRDGIHTPRIGGLVTPVLWVAAAVLVCWSGYRYLGRVQPVWRNEPARRPQLVVWSALELLATAIFVYALLKRPDVFAATTIGIAIVVIGVQYFRRRRRESL
jgi:hypothetical protein